MKFTRYYYLCLVLVLASFAFACSGKPVEMIEKTQAVMEQAKAEHADEFASDEWKSGEDAWKKAQGLMEKEKWGESNAPLLNAKGHFEKAREQAKGKRAAAIQEIEGTKVTAEKRCQALKDSLNAEGKKLPAAKQKEFGEICKASEEKIAKAAEQLKNGQYNDAKLLAGTTLREIWEAQKELESLTGKKK
jgi:hypothetical protein